MPLLVNKIVNHLQMIYKNFNNINQSIMTQKIKEKFKITTPETLLIAVCKYYNLTPAHLITPNRATHLVLIRQLYVYIGKHYYKYNQRCLSRCLKQDHTAGVHSIIKIQGLIDVKDARIANEIERLLTALKFKYQQKRMYEKRYDALLEEFLELKQENKRLQNTLDFLNIKAA